VAHNTKPILTDVNGKPIPQYFDPLADEYKPLLGQHGAARSILYGPDDQPITNENPLEVRARLLEELLGAIKDSDGIKKIADAVTVSGLENLATETKLEAVRTLVEDLKSELLLVKSELANIKANQLSGDQKVQLSGNDVVIGLLADRPPASEMRGRGYYAWDETDGHKLKYSDGTNWRVNQ